MNSLSANRSMRWRKKNKLVISWKKKWYFMRCMVRILLNWPLRKPNCYSIDSFLSNFNGQKWRCERRQRNGKQKKKTKIKMQFVMHIYNLSWVLNIHHGRIVAHMNENWLFVKWKKKTPTNWWNAINLICLLVDASIHFEIGYLIIFASKAKTANAWFFPLRNYFLNKIYFKPECWCERLLLYRFTNRNFHYEPTLRTVL